jgi:chloramphenicol O-acetyltransferase type A
MKTTLNLESWPRKDHFNFFRQFEEPFFGVTVSIDCTNAYNWCKQNEVSFFLYYLHASLKAANAIEPFRYRIDGDSIHIFDIVGAGPTIMRPDGTFGFANILYKENFRDFVNDAQVEINKIKNSSGLDPAATGEDVIHYSSLPWINFTGLSHARSFSYRSSVPKISFGKMIEYEGLRSMPVSIHVHHGLVDGIHVGQFIDLFQQIMDNHEAL